MLLQSWNDIVYQVETWLTDQQIASVDYSDYWNDESFEVSKEFYVLNGNFAKMEDYLAKTGLASDLTSAVSVITSKFRRQLNGVGIDLAAGNLWAVPFLFNLGGKIDRLYCLELSRHRLFKLGPVVLQHYGIPQDRVVLALGSFYELHVEDESMDFVLLAQAFHHADAPDRLLKEIWRVLKPKGIVIIIGEHLLRTTAWLARDISKFIISQLMPERFQRLFFGKVFKKSKLRLLFSGPLKPDPILGDHYYTSWQYAQMFNRNGFEHNHIMGAQSNFQSFILMKSSEC